MSFTPLTPSTTRTEEYSPSLGLKASSPEESSQYRSSSASKRLTRCWNRVFLYGKQDPFPYHDGTRKSTEIASLSVTFTASGKSGFFVGIGEASRRSGFFSSTGTVSLSRKSWETLHVTRTEGNHRVVQWLRIRMLTMNPIPSSTNKHLEYKVNNLCFIM